MLSRTRGKRALALQVAFVLLVSLLAATAPISPLASTPIAAQTTEVFPSSYEMENGSIEFFDYRDDSYSTCLELEDGCPGGAALSGGLGDLTDGVIAESNWREAETPESPGPYVGWRNSDPVITFRFSESVDLGRITFHVDDSNGDGNVKTPSSIEVAMGGGTQWYQISDPDGSDPFAVDLDVSALAASDSVTVTVHRQLGGFSSGSEIPVPDDWVFISEVEFFGGDTRRPSPPT